MNAGPGPGDTYATIARLSPGTALRDGLERILRGRTGALIVIGYDQDVEQLCDGGFVLDIEFSAPRLRELSKMDGAVVLSTDATRILRANVQLVPDHLIPTVESGTRHRAAERTALQTGYPVISVSQSTRIVSVYTGGVRHVLESPDILLSRANQAVATLERYKSRADEVTRSLSVAEIEDFVALRDALVVLQRLEMVRRVSVEIERYVIELGVDGRQLALQLEDLVGSNEQSRTLIVRDYARTDFVDDAAVAERLALLDRLDDTELLDLSALAEILGYARAVEALEESVHPRGYRLLTRVPRLRLWQIHRLVEAFGSLQALLASTAAELEAVDGIGVAWARRIREGLSRLAESAIANPYA